MTKVNHEHKDTQQADRHLSRRERRALRRGVPLTFAQATASAVHHNTDNTDNNVKIHRADHRRAAHERTEDYRFIARECGVALVDFAPSLCDFDIKTRKPTAGFTDDNTPGGRSKLPDDEVEVSRKYVSKHIIRRPTVEPSREDNRYTHEECGRRATQLLASLLVVLCGRTT